MNSKLRVYMSAALLVLISSVAGLAQPTQTTKPKTSVKRAGDTATKTPPKTAKVVTTDKLKTPSKPMVAEGRSIIVSTPDGIKVLLHPNMTWEFWSEPKPASALFGPNLKSYPMGELIESLNTINFSKSEFETKEEYEARIVRDFGSLRLKSDSRKVSDFVLVFDRKWDGTSFPDIQSSTNYNADTQEFTFPLGWALPKLILDENSRVIKYSDIGKTSKPYYLEIGVGNASGKTAGIGKCTSDPNASDNFEFKVPVSREKAKQIADYMRIAVFATPSCFETVPADDKSPAGTKVYLTINRFVVFDRRNGEIYFDFPAK